MIENHTICDLGLYDESFEVFNHLGHRDKQVIRQCLQNFSVVVGMLRTSSSVPKVLETGTGLSTLLFSKMLHLPGEEIKTIDAFALDAIQVNSRGVSASFSLSRLDNCEIIKGTTIDAAELGEFYSSPNSTLGSLSHELLLAHLDLFSGLSHYP